MLLIKPLGCALSLAGAKKMFLTPPISDPDKLIVGNETFFWTNAFGPSLARWDI